MNILGIYIGGHDSNVSIVKNGKVHYYKAERLFQHKHKRATIDWVKSLCEEKQFQPDFVCFSDGNRNDLGSCEIGELYREVAPLACFPRAKTYCIDHHYAHILSAWTVLPSKAVNYGISIDGRGDHTIRCSIIEKPFDVANASLIFSTLHHEYCITFNRIGSLMGLSGGELDFAGKIMGAHAYGKADEWFVEQYNTSYYQSHPIELLKIPFHHQSIEQICAEQGPLFYNWLATIHKLLEGFICQLFLEYIPTDSHVVYAGGGAQNTVYNERLSMLYPHLTIPPHCYDGGISLGCVELVALLTNSSLRIVDFPFSQGEADVGYASDEVIAQVVELLANNKVVGWCQGRGEIGPRALGHRSILMNPAAPNAKDYLNKKVKKREFWRPYAASVKRESIEKLTDRDRDGAYMLHAMKVKEEYYASLQAVIHEDGTCRFQTVENKGPLVTYYRLLDLFEQRTGCLGVLNTSLNIGGKPIVSTAQHAKELFETVDLDAICIGNQLILR